MRVVQTEKVLDGAVLAHDVFGGPTGTIPLLREGVKIDLRYRKALLAAGIPRIAVEDAETEGIQVRPVVTPGARLEAHGRLAKLLTATKQSFGRGDRFHYDLLGESERIASLLLDEALENGRGPIGLLPTTGSQAHDVRHPVDTLVTGVLIARLLFSERGRIIAGTRTTDGVDDALRRISLGLLIHDIGHGDHDEDIRVEDGEIVEADATLLRPHVERAHQALPHSVISAHAAAVVRDHHERWSGEGPSGLEGDRIPQFARIAAVADVFDELTSDKPGRHGLPPNQAVAAICREAGRKFDPEVVDIFRRVIAPFPVGSEVRLGDGFEGVVSGVPHDTPHRPNVRLLRDPHGKRIKAVEVSTYRETGLSIQLAA